MRYMLDTNILIYLLKNRPVSVAQRINKLGEDAQLCMSFFTYAEMLKGAERSTRKRQSITPAGSISQAGSRYLSR